LHHHQSLLKIRLYLQGLVRKGQRGIPPISFGIEPGFGKLSIGLIKPLQAHQLQLFLQLIPMPGPKHANLLIHPILAFSQLYGPRGIINTHPSTTTTIPYDNRSMTFLLTTITTIPHQSLSPAMMTPPLHPLTKDYRVPALQSKRRKYRYRLQVVRAAAFLLELVVYDLGGVLLLAGEVVGGAVSALAEKFWWVDGFLSGTVGDQGGTVGDEDLLAGFDRLHYSLQQVHVLYPELVLALRRLLLNPSLLLRNILIQILLKIHLHSRPLALLEPILPKLVVVLD